MARFRAGTAAQPDFDALKDFAELPDREASPFFGGRTNEIATVEHALNRIRKRTQEGHWRPAGGETVVFQGAPGAGKSALLHHMVKIWRNSGQNAPVVVDTDRLITLKSGGSHSVSPKLRILLLQQFFDGLKQHTLVRVLA